MSSPPDNCVLNIFDRVTYNIKSKYAIEPKEIPSIIGLRICWWLPSIVAVREIASRPNWDCFGPGWEFPKGRLAKRIIVGRIFRWINGLQRSKDVRWWWETFSSGSPKQKAS